MTIPEMPDWYPWFLSGMSCLFLWVTGSKRWWAPALGLLNQVWWIVYAFWTGDYGLIAGSLVYAVINTRNLYLWVKGREPKPLAPPSRVG